MKPSPLHPWAEQEFRAADLGDRRLNRRLVRLAGDLAACPASSVPFACRSWPAVKAAYRFWDNDRVRPDAILRPHVQSTAARLPRDGTPVLAVQDTTVLNLTAHRAATGLGYLSSRKQRGLFVHSTLCLTTAGVPPGLLAQHVWARADASFGKRQGRNRRATRAKESQRWLDALQATERALPAGQKVVTVADREADFYDLFAAARRGGHDLLIRAKSRRRIRHEARLLGQGIAARPVRGRLKVQVPRADGRPARTAVLRLRFGRFAIAPPCTHLERARLAALTLSVVLAEEENPPAGVKPVRWLLLSTLPLPDRRAAQRLVRWYARRWRIERYHLVLKSGCRLEQLQLATAARRRRALATYAVVAWRLLWLTYQARQEAAPAADAAFTAEEWQLLQRQAGQAATAAPPRLRQAVRWLGGLGGFLGRKGDGEPGVQVLWRGLRRLQEMLAGYRLARQEQGTPPIRYG